MTGHTKREAYLDQRCQTPRHHRKRVAGIERGPAPLEGVRKAEPAATEAHAGVKTPRNQYCARARDTALAYLVAVRRNILLAWCR